MALSIQERIKDLRVERTLTLEQLAEHTGLSKSALGSYESDDFKDISHYALIKLADFYEVSVDYLLGRMETKNHPNAEVSNLHLSDTMIELLKNDQVDAPLLCELATHPEFIKLLADIQIYIEGIASMQIQTLNSWVDAVRSEIAEKYRPGEQDRTFQLLQATHIDEGEYFSRRVHDDIDIIMKDLRTAHLGKNDSAPKATVVDTLKKDLEEVMNFKGSRLEQLIMLFCTQTKIKYQKLTEEEKQWLIRIAQKSELAKSHISQRGKKY